MNECKPLASGNLKVSVNGRDVSDDVRERMSARAARGVAGRGAGANERGAAYVGGSTGKTAPAEGGDGVDL